MSNLITTLLRHIDDMGFEVTANETADFIIMLAVDRQTGERHTVRMQGRDHCKAACELAKLVGIELEDG